MQKYEQYEHHDTKVWVKPELKGKHREHCLCFDCKYFHPGKDWNCKIAKAIYANCVEFNVVTPVWECPSFRPSNYP